MDDTQRGRSGPSCDRRRTIEQRLEADAVAFQAHCAALDCQGALNRTLERLGLAGPEPQD